MMYRLVVLDIDGTLLSPKGVITDRVINVVKNTKKAGTEITIATGRSFTKAKRIIDQLNIKFPVILFTGSLVLEPITEQVIYENCLSNDIYQKSLDLILANGWQPVIHQSPSISGNTFSASYEFGQSPEITAFLESGFSIKSVGIKYLFGLNRILGISVFSEFDEFNEHENDIQAMTTGNVITYSPSSNHPKAYYQLDIMSPTCSKGYALKHLIKKYNIISRDVIAIGDNDNDVDMFREAGLGVAMENGSEKVKCYADVIVASNENDGVAEALEKYVLNK